MLDHGMRRGKNRGHTRLLRESPLRTMLPMADGPGSLPNDGTRAGRRAIGLLAIFSDHAHRGFVLSTSFDFCTLKTTLNGLELAQPFSQEPLSRWPCNSPF